MDLSTHALHGSVFVCALLAACGGAHNEKFRQDPQYRQPQQFEYAFAPHGALEAPQEVLGAEWIPDTLSVGSQYYAGRESSRPGKRIKQHYDWDQDGRIDHSEDVPQYDLRLVHGSGAIISIRAVPVPTTLEELSLSELAAAYLEAITHQGESAALFNPEDLITQTGTLFEIRVIDEAGCRVSGVEAHRVEIAGHRTAPEPSPERRTRLVVVRPGFRRTVAGADDHDVPVMLVAAYTHAPEVFDELEDDFNRFLNSWVLGGYGAAIPTERLGHTCQP